MGEGVTIEVEKTVAEGGLGMDENQGKGKVGDVTGQEDEEGLVKKIDNDKDRHADGDGKQKVYVLDGGFVKWQELYVYRLICDSSSTDMDSRYGNDERLTEGYVPDIWKDY